MHYIVLYALPITVQNKSRSISRRLGCSSVSLQLLGGVSFLSAAWYFGHVCWWIADERR